jgi:tRNA (cytidine/uridine-2'-O-)-methyltransferase
VADDWAVLQPKLPTRQPWFFTKHATRLYDEVEFATDDVFVFGSESSGLPAGMWQATPERALRIPIRPEARSLNLSNSVAIALFEARRQWAIRKTDDSSQ